jgi:hypothetical protein
LTRLDSDPKHRMIHNPISYTHTKMRCVVIQFILSIITWLSFTIILTCLSISFLDITNNYHLLEQEHLSEHYSSNIAWHSACNASSYQDFQKPFTASRSKMVCIDCSRVAAPAFVDVKNRTMHSLLQTTYQIQDVYLYHILFQFINIVIHQRIYWFFLSIFIIYIWTLCICTQYLPMKFYKKMELKLDHASYNNYEKEEEVATILNELKEN